MVFYRHVIIISCMFLDCKHHNRLMSLFNGWETSAKLEDKSNPPVPKLLELVTLWHISWFGTCWFWLCCCPKWILVWMWSPEEETNRNNNSAYLSRTLWCHCDVSVTSVCWMMSWAAVSCRTWLHKRWERCWRSRIHVGFLTGVCSLLHGCRRKSLSGLIVSSSLVSAESCYPKVKLLWPIRAEPRPPVRVKFVFLFHFLFNWWRWWINITVCVITVIAHLKCYIWIMRPLRIRDWFELIECFYFETWLTVFPVCRRTDQLFVFIHRCSTRLWKRSREERWNFVMSSDSKGLFCVFVSFYLAVYQERCYGGRGLTGALRCTMSTQNINYQRKVFRTPDKIF